MESLFLFHNYPSGVSSGCSGSVIDYCHTFDQGQVECDAEQPACRYNDYDSWCEPMVADYCSTLTLEGPCISQGGCTWNPGTRIPGKNAGSTYFLEGITSKPLAVSIIPIISGEQCGSTDTLHEIDDCRTLLS